MISAAPSHMPFVGEDPALPRSEFITQLQQAKTKIKAAERRNFSPESRRVSPAWTSRLKGAHEADFKIWRCLIDGSVTTLIYMIIP